MHNKIKIIKRLHPANIIAKDLEISKNEVNVLMHTLQTHMTSWKISIENIARFLLQDFYTNPKIDKQSVLINNGVKPKLAERFYEALLWPVTPWDSWKYMTTKKTIEKLMPVFNQLQ